MNKPLINYYARLIVRGDYKFEDVPDNLKDYVKKRMDEIQPAEEKEDK